MNSAVTSWKSRKSPFPPISLLCWDEKHISNAKESERLKREKRPLDFWKDLKQALDQKQMLFLKR